MSSLESKSPCYWKDQDSINTSVCPFQLLGDNQYSNANHTCHMWSICKDGDDCAQLDCTKKHVSLIYPDALLNGVLDLKLQSGHYFNRFMLQKHPEIQRDQEVVMIQKLRHIYINRMKHLQLPRGACTTSVLLPSEDPPSQIMRQVQSAKALLDIVLRLKYLVFSRVFGANQNESKFGVLSVLLFRYPDLMTDKQRYLFGTGERRDSEKKLRAKADKQHTIPVTYNSLSANSEVERLGKEA